MEARPTIHIHPSVPINSQYLAEYREHFEDLQEGFPGDDTAVTVKPFNGAGPPQLVDSTTYEMLQEVTTVLLEGVEEEERNRGAVRRPALGERLDYNIQQWPQTSLDNMHQVIYDITANDGWYANALPFNPFSDVQAEGTGLCVIKLKIDQLTNMTPKEFESASACILKLKYMQHSYQVLQNTEMLQNLVDVATQNGVEWFVFVDPYLTAIRVDLRERIGKWMFDHPHLWENTGITKAGMKNKHCYLHRQYPEDTCEESCDLFE